MRDKVVIVDDEPLTRMDFCEIFEEAGYDVVGRASDGYDAIDLCRKFCPDLVLMDIKMPIFNGLSAAEIIIGENLCECVVLVTAFNDSEFISKAKRTGVMGYLIKPLDEKVLLPAVEIALAKSKEIRNMKAEMQRITQEAEDAKYIEQAKGIVAKMYQISESEAYNKIRRLSMDKRCSVTDMAQNIVKSNSDRADIEKAKKLLMARYANSEKEAFNKIKDYGKRHNCSANEAAAAIIDQFLE